MKVVLDDTNYLLTSWIILKVTSVIIISTKHVTIQVAQEGFLRKERKKILPNIENNV